MAKNFPQCVLGFEEVTFSKRVIYTKENPKRFTKYTEYDELITSENKKSYLASKKIVEFMDLEDTYLVEGHIDGTDNQIVWFISAKKFYIEVP